jgi:putative membrane protein
MIETSPRRVWRRREERHDAGMARDPYARFDERELILRDQLAVDRTALANERTLLAYVRTALALAAAGASLIHFLDSGPAHVSGACLVAGAVATAGIGIHRYARERRRLARFGPGPDPDGSGP